MLVLILSAALSAGPAHSLDCPPTVPVTRQRLQEQVEGWTTFVPAQPPHFLTRVGLFRNHPRELAQLKPEIRRTRVSWKHLAGAEVWQSCWYANTSVSLIRQLPAGIEACSYQTTPGIEPSIEGFVCQ